jgi:hypothetical protein
MSFDKNKEATRLRGKLKELHAERAELQAQLLENINEHNKHHKYPSVLFGGRETAFEQLLDRLVKRFEIADREKLKLNIVVAAMVYDGGFPSRLSRDDLDQLRDLAPKMAGALRRNASAIVYIFTKFEGQHAFDPKPESYDQGRYWRDISTGPDDFVTRILQAPRTLMELAHVLSQCHPVAGRPPDEKLRHAVAFLQSYWRDELGRRVKAEPWKRGMFGEFLKAVFEFIDPAAVGKLPSAMKRARTSEKNTL